MDLIVFESLHGKRVVKVVVGAIVVVVVVPTVVVEAGVVAGATVVVVVMGATVVDVVIGAWVVVVVVVAQLEETHKQLYDAVYETHTNPGVVHGFEAQKSTAVVVVTNWIFN